MKKLLLILVLSMGGCCTAYPGASYVSADESTYNYAQPKLVEWADRKGGDWPSIVEDKGISWKARIYRAKKKGKEADSE